MFYILTLKSKNSLKKMPSNIILKNISNKIDVKKEFRIAAFFSEITFH